MTHKSGVELIALERDRQISVKGYTPEHDDVHTLFELSKAATSRLRSVTGWWDYQPGPQECIRILAKAGALIAAEIDRLQRMQNKLVEIVEKEVDLGAMLGSVQTLQGIKVLAVRVRSVTTSRELAETLRDKLGDSIVLVGAEHQGKAMLVLTVAKTLTSKFNAADLIRPIAAIVSGSGGGRPDMAQAGGTVPSKLDEALAELYVRLSP